MKALPRMDSNHDKVIESPFGALTPFFAAGQIACRSSHSRPWHLVVKQASQYFF
jgi:hypothetical protein